MKKHHHHLKTLHPMASFGVVTGVTKQVRVTRLETRLNPAVPFPHKHSFYHLVIITKGSGWHEIDFKRHTVKPGAVFFMRPAQVHSWSMNKNTHGIVIEFEGLSIFSGDDEAYRILSGALNPNKDYFPLKGKERESVELLAKNMLKEYEEAVGDFELFLKLELAKLLLLFSRYEKNEVKKITSTSEFREKFTAVVEKNYKHHHEIPFYAEAMKLTPKSLTAKVNRIMGKNVRTLIQERCVLEAQRLLAYSDLSISEISNELGFIDPNYFTRFFKLKTKSSPGKFREKVRKIC
jgi:AraC-like DNA-binding protein